MLKIIKSLLLLAFLVLAACTNDETDEGLELLTPNETEETAAVVGTDLEQLN